ncbi:MAG TPA: DPP IV N-terminal domain-containing protein [Gaiellaceae bacterium]
MRLGRRFVWALAAALLLVVLPLGGALGATSSGANGDIAFVQGGSILSANTGTVILSGGVDPSWSPDGTKLAFSAGGSIKTCTVSSCTTAGAALDSGTEPVWSPDGTKIAYVKANQIWVVASGGGSLLQITTSGTNADPSWSPDGTQLAITSNGVIATVAASAGASPSPIMTTGISGTSQPAWSPDGSSIAFQSSASGHSQIYVVPVTGGTPVQVTVSPSSFATDEETAPSWSPDSTSIVYADSSHGIQDAAKGAGGAWGTPSTRDGNTSDATPDWQTIAPIAVAPPSISGGFAPQTGQLLSTTNGSWSGANSGGFSYLWERCDSSGNSCISIPGATASTYAVVSADVGNTLRSIVTASNVAGATQSAPSAATGVVTLAGSVNPPALLTPPVISLPTGETTPMLGDILFATAGTWGGSFPMTFTYSWTKCDPTDPLNGQCLAIPGATLSFFTVPPALYGMRIRVRVTATNAAGSVSQSSAATDIVGATAPALSVTPAIVGQNIVGQTLSVSPGSWFGSTPLTYAYVWRRCDPVGDLSTCVAITGATASSYVAATTDIGFSLRVYITATNVVGSASGITNHTFPIVDRQHFAPTASSGPSISGAAALGQPLLSSVGSFSGDTPISTKFVWQRCDATGGACRRIVKATKARYTPTQIDLGSTLRILVTAKNAYGTVVTPSDVTAPVTPPWPHRRGRRIIGTATSDNIVGTDQDDVIYGLGGNDAIQGGGGYDVLYGGSGNDVITVTGPGGSNIYGGPGSDTIYAADGFRDFIDCGPGRDRAYVDAVDTVKNCEVVTVVGSSSSSSNATPGRSRRR